MKPSASRAQDRQELRLFANALRAWLGKGPLYGASRPETDLERFYIAPVPLPDNAGGEWFRSLSGAEGSREEFRERSIARSAERRRRGLKFERKEKSP